MKYYLFLLILLISFKSFSQEIDFSQNYNCDFKWEIKSNFFNKSLGISKDFINKKNNILYIKSNFEAHPFVKNFISNPNIFREVKYDLINNKILERKSIFDKNLYNKINNKNINEEKTNLQNIVIWKYDKNDFYTFEKKLFLIKNKTIDSTLFIYFPLLNIKNSGTFNILNDNRTYLAEIKIDFDNNKIIFNSNDSGELFIKDNFPYKWTFLTKNQKINANLINFNCSNY